MGQADEETVSALHEIHRSVKGCKTYLGWILALMLIPVILSIVFALLTGIGAAIAGGSPSSTKK